MPLSACDPLVPSVPDQAPDAAQPDAEVDDQVNVALPPLATLLGLALKDTVGGVAVTETVVEFDEVPPAPVQVSTNFVAALNATVAWLPLVGSEPVQPPDAAQDVAFVADQLSVEVLPDEIEVGLALMVTEGAVAETVTVVVCAALPPGPAQVRV
jgi:hypothetical protein